MPTLAEIRTAIINRMNAIPNIGKVHSYPRRTNDIGKLIQHYVSTAHGQIRGWDIERFKQVKVSPAIGRKVVRNHWRITGQMAIDDEAATRIAFDNLVEAINDKFDEDEDLGGVVSSTVIDDFAGIQIEEEADIIFAETVACHSARLLLITEHYK